MNDGKKFNSNLLFLDFDGVCNSWSCGSHVTHKPDEYGSDPSIVRRIGEICSRCNARIILSSNWRRFPADGVWRYRERDYVNPLPSLYRQLGHLIDGTLTTERHLSKCEALELWFEYNPSFDCRYAIVDDNPKEGFQSSGFSGSFWLTNPEFGLTEKIKDEIVKHLGE